MSPAGSLVLAASPTSWGVDFADAPDNPPWSRVLDEIGRSGLGRLELGPVGYLPEDPEVLRPELEARGLEAIGSFVFQPLHDPDRRAEVLEVARRTSRMVAAAGGRLLVVIDVVSDTRAPTAGRPGDAPRLAGSDWEALRDAVRDVAEVAREHDLRPVLHHHAGSYVEFPDELAALLAAVPAEELGACLDTGHALYAGADPAALARELGPRLEHVHLKDVDLGRLDAVRDAGGGFWDAVGADVFCPIGTGAVDFAAFGAALEAIGYEGAATLEQDLPPGRSETALDDLLASVEALRGAGVAPTP